MYQAFQDSHGRARHTQFGPTDRFRHVGIISDYVRIPYAAGSTFAAQLLHRELKSRGHEVTIIGPEDPSARPEELPGSSVQFPGIPVPSQPGFFIPVPGRDALRQLAQKKIDVLIGQTGSSLMDAGVWLRATQKVPMVCVNTAMLSSIYDAALPESLSENARVQAICQKTIVPFVEQMSVKTYNQADSLIVLSQGLKQYWKDLGVRVPIHVIPRTIDPHVSGGKLGKDPFDPRAKPGQRMLVLCRHVREKGLSRLIDIFAEQIAPALPEASFTMVGDGADHDSFKRRVAELGLEDRIFFPGEVAVTEVRNWYAHADVFVYASLSETYGQVISEAMWCGLPVVAFDDHAGVAQQIRHGETGYLLPAGPSKADTNRDFGEAVRGLLRNHIKRKTMADAARSVAAERIDPDQVIRAYYAVFEQAKRHRELSKPDAGLLRQYKPILRWAAIHSLAGLASSLRPAGELNRSGAQTPRWVDSPKPSQDLKDQVA